MSAARAAAPDAPHWNLLPPLDVRRAFPRVLDVAPHSGPPVRSSPVSVDSYLRRPGEGIRAFLLRMPVLPVVPFSWEEGPGLPSHVMMRDRLVAQARKVIGAAEHVQVASLVSAARSYRLDAHATEALALTVQHATATLERNLDLVAVPPEGVWIEWPEHARYRATPRRGASHPVVSGALVAPWPGDTEALTVVTGWMTEDGTVRHSYATAVLHKGHLALRAWSARVKETDHSPKAALERLREAFTVSVPPGLEGELEFLVGVEVEHGDREGRDADEVRAEAARMAALDVAPDVPFVLAVLVLLGSRSAEVTSQEPIDVLSCLPDRMTLGDRCNALLGRPRGDGFLRSGVNKGASARLVRPAGAVPRRAPVPARALYPQPIAGL